jgi:hypothetical protein
MEANSTLRPLAKRQGAAAFMPLPPVAPSSGSNPEIALKQWRLTEQ